MTKKELLYAKDLPIYREQHKLTMTCIKIMIHCQRDLKHTIAQKLVDLAFWQKVLIGDVRREENKAKLLSEFLDRHKLIEETIKTLVELQAVEEKYYIEAMPLIESIERQAGGWFKASQAEDRQPESGIPSGECVK